MSEQRSVGLWLDHQVAVVYVDAEQFRIQCSCGWTSRVSWLAGPVGIDLDHHLEAVGGSEAATSVSTFRLLTAAGVHRALCSCGWESDALLAASHAGQAWDTHVTELHA